MHLINIKCNDNESFKYSILLYLYYYNIKKNHFRVSLMNNNLNPYIHIKFNENNDLCQFKKDNPFIDLLIVDINGNPLFLTRNIAYIKITIVKLNGNRYSLLKPSIECFNDNIREINKINRDTSKKSKLTDKIKKELALDFNEHQKCDWDIILPQHHYTYTYQKMCVIFNFNPYING